MADLYGVGNYSFGFYSAPDYTYAEASATIQMAFGGSARAAFVADVSALIQSSFSLEAAARTRAIQRAYATIIVSVSGFADAYGGLYWIGDDPEDQNWTDNDPAEQVWTPIGTQEAFDG